MDEHKDMGKEKVMNFSLEFINWPENPINELYINQILADSHILQKVHMKFIILKCA